MNKFVIELDENQESGAMSLIECKSEQPNIGMVKQEAPEADDISLKCELRTIKQENVSSEDQFESTSLNTFDSYVIHNQSLELKVETGAQDCWLESDQEIFVKEELLHEELDIKSEHEAVEQTHVDDKHNLGNKLCKHIKHPSTVNPYKCNICQYSCSKKNNFNIHIRTHTGEKSFKCPFCDYSCAQTSNLMSHLKTHTGEKPFTCDFCDYRCAYSSQLKQHLSIHTGDKPFKCNFCDYSCRYNSVLKRHLRSHTGMYCF